MGTSNSIGIYKPGKPSINHTVSYNENIVIIGAEVHDKRKVNKLMFMAQAVRRVKISSIQTVLYFKYGYSQIMVSEFEKSLKLIKNDIKIVSISNISEIINYINFGYKNGGNDCRTKPNNYGNIYKTKNIYIYSHGMPSRITFMLDWDIYKKNNKINSTETAHSNELNLKNFTLLNKNSFSKEAEIWSYACRTGINDDDADEVEIIWGGDKSLAQMISNELKINVNAYARRSNYGDTWGSWGDRRLLQGGDLDEKIFPKEIITYDDKFRNYKKEEMFIGKDKYPWQPQGAYRDVKAGDFPVGPPQKLLNYTPK